MHARSYRKRARGGPRLDRRRGIAKVRSVGKRAGEERLPGQLSFSAPLSLHGSRLTIHRVGEVPEQVDGEWLAPHSIKGSSFNFDTYSYHDGTPQDIRRPYYCAATKTSGLTTKYDSAVDTHGYPKPIQRRDTMLYKHVTSYDPYRRCGFALGPYFGLSPLSEGGFGTFSTTPFKDHYSIMKPMGGLTGLREFSFTASEPQIYGIESKDVGRWNSTYMPFNDQFGRFSVHHIKQHVQLRTLFKKMKITGQVEMKLKARMNPRFLNMLTEMMDYDRACQSYVWPNAVDADGTGYHHAPTGMVDVLDAASGLSFTVAGSAGTWFDPQGYKVGTTVAVPAAGLSDKAKRNAAANADTQFLWSRGGSTHDEATANGAYFRVSPGDVLGADFVKRVKKDIYDLKASLLWTPDMDDIDEDDTWRMSNSTPLRVGKVNRLAMNPYREEMRTRFTAITSGWAQNTDDPLYPGAARLPQTYTIHKRPGVVQIAPRYEEHVAGVAGSTDPKALYDEDIVYQLGHMAFSIRTNKQTPFPSIPDHFWRYWFRAHPYSMTKRVAQGEGVYNPLVWSPSDYTEGLVGRVMNNHYHASELTRKDMARLRELAQEHVSIVEFHFDADIGVTYYGMTDNSPWGLQLTAGDEDQINYELTTEGVPVPWIDRSQLKMINPDQPDRT